MTISDKIRVLMIKCGNVKEAEIARKTGISPQTLNLKMKKSYFTLEDLQKIAGALDCDFDVSFTIKGTGERYELYD